MKTVIAADPRAGSVPSGRQAGTAISKRAGCLAAGTTHGSDPPVSCSDGSLNTSRGALWRDTLLALMGVSVWITAVSVFLPRESLPAHLAVFVAATISSIAGFAFSAVAGGMLLHMIDSTVKVVMIMMICSIAIQSLSVAHLWREIDWRRLSTFLLGGVLGLPIGVWLLLHLDPRGIKGVIGALLVAYAAYGLFKRPASVQPSNGMWDIITGAIGGVTCGLAGFPGAAVTIWCGMQGLNKRRQRAIYQPYILVMQILGLMVIGVMRPAAAPAGGVAIDVLSFVPVALLGAWIGLKVFERLSENHFKLAVNVMLLVSGVGLIV